MNTKLPAILAAAALAALAGCATGSGPYAPQDTTKYTLENTEFFVAMDKPTQTSVTCTGLQANQTADGRLEVVANVKNRESRRIEVQINCVFKDEQGFSAGDETPWQLGALFTSPKMIESRKATVERFVRSSCVASPQALCHASCVSCLVAMSTGHRAKAAPSLRVLFREHPTKRAVKRVASQPFLLNGALKRTRTSNPQIRSLMLYPIEL